MKETNIMKWVNVQLISAANATSKTILTFSHARCLDHESHIVKIIIKWTFIIILEINAVILSVNPNMASDWLAH